MCGHEPPHAIMVTRGGERVVRTWDRATGEPQDGAVEIAALPWVRGLAIPLWNE